MKIKSFLALLLCIPLLLVACSPLSNASDNVDFSHFTWISTTATEP